MKVRLAELGRFDGTIDRRSYFALGVALGVLKLGLDYCVATRLFERSWSPFDYAVTGHWLFALSPQDRFFFRTMLLVAVPFMWCGVALTVRRLRSAGLPLFAVVLFFAPLPMNFIIFLVLSVLPPRSRVGDLRDEIDKSRRPPEYVRKQWMLEKAIPERRLWAAVTAIVLPLPFAIALIALCTRILQYYGWGVFVGIPFALPMISVILYGYHRPRSLAECLWLGMVWLGVAYGAVLVVAIEGIICLAMALPIAVPVVLLGSAVGYLIQPVASGLARLGDSCCS